VTHPSVAGRTDDGVDAEQLAGLVAVDRVDSSDVFGARRLGHVGEQQADRTLTDDRDAASS
jgi:hypothetical protein